jgi:capsular polysaccharide biosynthesis protein
MTLPELIKTAIRAMWRRRVIMLMPVLIILPLTVLAALFLPTRYETNALILLQEYKGLTGNVPNYLRSQELRDKINSLEALIKSEYIIQRTLARDQKEELTKTELEEYRKRITVEQVGNQFVSVALIGDRSDGLGDELSLILTTIFESLLVSDDSALNAPRFVIRKHREALAEIEKRLRETGSTNNPEFLTGIEQQRAAVLAAESELQATQDNVATLRAKLAEEAENSGFELDVIRSTPAVLLNKLEGQRKTHQENGDIDAASKMTGFIEAARRIEGAVRANDTARVKRDSAREALATLEETMRERTTLERQAERLRQRAALFEQRLSAAGQPADMQLLSAPAQIQIIDRPKDPRQRLDSRLKILLAGIVIAFAMSGAFALLSEQLDNRLRDAAALKTLAGAPVIVFPPGAFVTEREPDRRDAPPSTGSPIAAT